MQLSKYCAFLKINPGHLRQVWENFQLIKMWNYMTRILLIDMNWHFLWPKIFLASNLWLMGGLYFLYCAHRTNGSDRCWVGWLWRLIDWLHHTLGRTLVNGAITDHTLHIVGAITYITYWCVPHINGTMTERSVQSHIYHITCVIHIVSHIICDTYHITFRTD